MLLADDELEEEELEDDDELFELDEAGASFYYCFFLSLSEEDMEAGLSTFLAAARMSSFVVSAYFTSSTFIS